MKKEEITLRQIVIFFFVALALGIALMTISGLIPNSTILAKIGTSIVFVAWMAVSVCAQRHFPNAHGGDILLKERKGEE